jgi:hypothetical protein
MESKLIRMPRTAVFLIVIPRLTYFYNTDRYIARSDFGTRKSNSRERKAFAHAREKNGPGVDRKGFRRSWSFILTMVSKRRH